jgi:uncharacterized protein
MTQRPTLLPLAANRSPWASLALVFFLAVLGAFLGQSVVSLIYSLGTHGTEEAINVALYPRQWLLILQAATASGAFIVAPVLYLRIFERQDIRVLFQWRQHYAASILITLGLVLAFMVVDTWVIQWNMAIKLPSWLKTFEIWAQEKEATLQKITILLTTFRSLSELGIGILVMGVVPAIGEELLFRGLVQNLCHKLTNNVHLAIGISAFVFSAIHLQFYGFVPRFLLGMLFGYIYWWTKDLLFPMVAHLFNNTAILLMLFFHQHGFVEHNIANQKAIAGPGLIFFSSVVTTLALLLRHQSQRAD